MYWDPGKEDRKFVEECKELVSNESRRRRAQTMEDFLLECAEAVTEEVKEILKNRIRQDGNLKEEVIRNLDLERIADQVEGDVSDCLIQSILNSTGQHLENAIADTIADNITNDLDPMEWLEE